MSMQARPFDPTPPMPGRWISISATFAPAIRRNEVGEGSPFDSSIGHAGSATFPGAVRACELNHHFGIEFSIRFDATMSTQDPHFGNSVR